MPKLQAVSPPKPERKQPVKASFELHRELGWLTIVLGSREINAYWVHLPHRWHRWERSPRGADIGPLTIVVKSPESEEPHLRSVDGE